MQMKRLEGIVGQPLFHKQGRSFQLTTAGETLLEHAMRILSAHNDAVAAFSSPDLFGRVRFGCAEDYASRFLPAVLSGFRKCFPRIRVDILSAPGGELKKALLKKELDLCLLEGAWEGGKVIHREPLAWVTSPTGTAHDQDPLPLAVYHEGCPYRKWAVDGLRKSKRRFWVSFVSPSITSILAAVKTGLAVAPIGISSIEDALRVLGPENGFPLLPVSDVSLHQSPMAASETVACFANYVIDSFRRLDRLSPATSPTAG
jgi:DNA-binding transcriptional LysR family regulator